MGILKRLIPMLVPSLMVGCLYQVEIPQGNLLDTEKIHQLRPGMDPEACRYLLGTALLDHPFWAQRWDYLYELRRGGVIERQRLTLFFDEDHHLVALQGDFRPHPEQVKPRPKIEAVDVPKRQSSRSLFEIIERGLEALWPF